MKALIVEDEVDLRESMIAYLTINDWVCDFAGDVFSAIDKINSFEYDCILLDLMLPDGSGMKVLEELKKMDKTEALIIISANNTLEKKIEGLKSGADDYLAKPFHLSEMIARMYAITRRKQFNGKNLIKYNEIEIDLLSKSVSVNSLLVDFTKTELELLLFLIGNKGRVISKSGIAEHLSGDKADLLDNHNFVYAHIKNLKKKLSFSGSVDYIKTVYGLGYKWES